MGAVRLYIDIDEGKTPPVQEPHRYVPVIDCAPEQAAALKRRFRRQGYSVTVFPL